MNNCQFYNNNFICCDTYSIYYHFTVLFRLTTKSIGHLLEFYNKYSVYVTVTERASLDASSRDAVSRITDTHRLSLQPFRLFLLLSRSVLALE